MEKVKTHNHIEVEKDANNIKYLLHSTTEDRIELLTFMGNKAKELFLSKFAPFIKEQKGRTRTLLYGSTIKSYSRKPRIYDKERILYYVSIENEKQQIFTKLVATEGLQLILKKHELERIGVGAAEKREFMPNLEAIVKERAKSIKFPIYKVKEGNIETKKEIPTSLIDILKKTKYEYVICVELDDKKIIFLRGCNSQKEAIETRELWVERNKGFEGLKTNYLLKS